MTLYEVLGVPADASPAAIKAAYREAVKRHHPDAGGDPEQFIRVQRAQFVLCDSVRRARYDRTGIEEDATAADDQEARALLAALMLQFLDGRWTVPGSNVLVDLEDALRRDEAAHQKIRADVGAQIIKLDALVRRLKHDGEGEDILQAIIDERRSVLANAQDRETSRLRVIERAREVLGRYAYRIDPIPADEAAIWSALSGGD